MTFNIERQRQSYVEDLTHSITTMLEDIDEFYADTDRFDEFYKECRLSFLHCFTTGYWSCSNNRRTALRASVLFHLPDFITAFKGVVGEEWDDPCDYVLYGENFNELVDFLHSCLLDTANKELIDSMVYTRDVLFDNYYSKSGEDFPVLPQEVFNVIKGNLTQVLNDFNGLNRSTLEQSILDDKELSVYI